MLLIVSSCQGEDVLRETFSVRLYVRINEVWSKTSCLVLEKIQSMFLIMNNINRGIINVTGNSAYLILLSAALGVNIPVLEWGYIGVGRREVFLRLVETGWVPLLHSYVVGARWPSDWHWRCVVIYAVFSLPQKLSKLGMLNKMHVP